MRIDVKSQADPARPELLYQARRAVALALGRFSSRIERVSVRLSDAEAPCGGSQKLTTIAVEGRRRWKVRVRHFAHDWPTALAGAARRARRAVARTLEQIRSGTSRGAA
jgi:hypothetical protein